MSCVLGASPVSFVIGHVSMAGVLDASRVSCVMWHVSLVRVMPCNLLDEWTKGRMSASSCNEKKNIRRVSALFLRNPAA